MNIVLWVAQALLALAYGAAGFSKVATSYESLLENPRMGWVEDLSPGTVKGIGVLEVLGAVGLIFPGLFGIATILTPIAAAALALVQAAAIPFHLRRGEYQMCGTVVLPAVALVVAWGRFGSYPLG